MPITNGNRIMSEFSVSPIDQLKQLMERLRHPTEGCPWDREQTFETVAPYIIEEAYEVEDAIVRKDSDAICEELGDLLLQIVFHSRIAEEQGLFDFDTVAKKISNKMIERHPHVFGQEDQRSQTHDSEAWENQKTLERKQKNNVTSGTLDGVALALPALMRSEKLIKRVKRAGYELTQPEKLLERFQEKLEQNHSPAKDKDQKSQNEKWVGELFFMLNLLVVHLGVDTEKALRNTNRKFENEVEEFEKGLNFLDAESISQNKGQLKDLLMKFYNIRD